MTKAQSLSPILLTRESLFQGRKLLSQISLEVGKIDQVGSEKVQDLIDELDFLLTEPIQSGLAGNCGGCGLPLGNDEICGRSSSDDPLCEICTSQEGSTHDQ